MYILLGVLQLLVEVLILWTLSVPLSSWCWVGQKALVRGMRVSLAKANNTNEAQGDDIKELFTCQTNKGVRARHLLINSLPIGTWN